MGGSQRLLWAVEHTFIFCELLRVFFFFPALFWFEGPSRYFLWFVHYLAHNFTQRLQPSFLNYFLRFFIFFQINTWFGLQTARRYSFHYIFFAFVSIPRVLQHFFPISLNFHLHFYQFQSIFEQFFLYFLSNISFPQPLISYIYLFKQEFHTFICSLYSVSSILNRTEISRATNRFSFRYRKKMSMNCINYFVLNRSVYILSDIIYMRLDISFQSSRHVKHPLKG